MLIGRVQDEREADDLLAANGIRGLLRPTVMQAAGPAAASAFITAFSPGFAFAAVATSQLLAVGIVVSMRTVPLRREVEAGKHPLKGALDDLREGFRYVVKTPWLWATLLFACLLVFVIIGPIEVLLPFAVKDQTGGGAGAFALALAAFGLGGATGSILIASLPLPRRYLTVMIGLWGAGAIPLAIIGLTSNLWLMIVALFIVGFSFSAAGVIWSTLLQRRVPADLIGRVSSLDFFVSLAFMPLSMAFAGPLGEAIGLTPAFLVAGLVPIGLAVVTITAARIPRDELLHPLEPS
jgi:predicted MFS family arabinose efflux permease